MTDVELYIKLDKRAYRVPLENGIEEYDLYLTADRYTIVQALDEALKTVLAQEAQKNDPDAPSRPDWTGIPISENASRLIENFETTVSAIDILGATEVGDAERALKEYIAELEQPVCCTTFVTRKYHHQRCVSPFVTEAERHLMNRGMSLRDARSEIYHEMQQAPR